MPDTLLGGIAINEILVDPNGALNYDTDGNGTASATDEYIELVNTSGSAIDISGLQVWDSGSGNVFTIPPGSILQPGAHALIVTGVQAGGTLPTGGDPNDLVFDVGRGSAYINNGGDNVVIYDPANDEFIQATFNGDSLDNPTAGAGGYAGFSATATRVGLGEDFGADTDGESLQRVDDTSDTFVSDTPTPADTNVCFDRGRQLATPDGTVRVEAVRPGDVLITADGGPQQVQWVGARKWPPQALRARRHLAPIRIRRGALGSGRPLRDLYLSPQHRVLVRGPIAQRMFGHNEVMVAAKHLCGLSDVDVVVPTRTVVYHYVMFARHEVVLAEGVEAESLYLGKQALRSISQNDIAEIAVLLGVTSDDLPDQAPEPVRPFAIGPRAHQLVARHAKNKKPVQGVTLPPASYNVAIAAPM